MSSLTTTWCPSSFQLRLAFGCRKPSSAFVRLRFQNVNHRPFRIYSVAGTGNSPNTDNENGVDGESERRRSGNTWTNSNSSADGFAGWSGAEQSDNSNSNQSLGGIVGAGLAGVLLVAGVTFAALAIGKKSTSGVKQEMEPLTVQQEISLDSNDEDEKSEEKNKGENDMPENSKQESNSGGDNDSSLCIDNPAAVESRLGDDTELGHTPNENDTFNNSIDQQDLQKDMAILGKSAGSEGTSNSSITEKGSDSFVSPIPVDDNGSESKGGSLVAEQPESVFQPEKPDFVDDNLRNLSVFDSSSIHLSSDHQRAVPEIEIIEHSSSSLGSSPDDSITLNSPATRELDSALEPNITLTDDQGERVSYSVKQVSGGTLVSLAEQDNSPSEFNKAAAAGTELISTVAHSLVNEQGGHGHNYTNVGGVSIVSTNSGDFFTSAGVPAPSLVSAALQAHLGKVLVPAVVDQVQSQTLAALQVLKVIEADVQPGDLCTRREYARWLVSASSALSRNSISKVYPAMYIENGTELAFDDITPEDPDFPSIQGLAEAGLIASKLSRRDMQSSSEEDETPFYFSPECPLSRQDLVSWKMALERRQLPVVNRKTIEQLSGFIDIDKIHPDAWPALAADLAAEEQGIVALAFGYTRLFQPDKPVTKAQAAVALATGEASDIVNEELARIDAESMAEKAVAAHSDLVAQVEKDINATFEKQLILEKEKADAVEKLAEETRKELEILKAQREEENLAIMKERAAVDSEMEVLSRLRREVEEQLQVIMSNKVEISYDKQRVEKLRKDAENENQEIARLQYELEVERKALSMARAWAEDEAKRAREQAKALEEARGHWERQGIKVIVDDNLQEEANAAVTWLNASKEVTVEETVDRAEDLVDKLKRMADVVRGRSKDTIKLIIQKMLSVISALKDLASKAGKQAGELKDAVVSKLNGSFQEAQQSSAEFTSAAKDGIKRIAVDCKEGVDKFSQRFKT